jgi:hypothetical protein
MNEARRKPGFFFGFPSKLNETPVLPWPERPSECVKRALVAF